MGADCKSAGFMPTEVRILSSPGIYKEMIFLRVLFAGVAQLVEHQPSKLRVAGSNLVSRFPYNGIFGTCSFLIQIKMNAFRFAHVAQSAEHFLGKEEVTGPIPVVG